MVDANSSRRAVLRGAVVLGAGAAIGGLEAYTATSAFAAPAVPSFTAPPEGYAGYAGQSTCDPTAKPGVVDFRDMLLSAYPSTGNSGITRACADGDQSEHKEGRAFDWGVSASSQANIANDLLNWLFATRDGHAHALIRRLGIMYIIWNRRIWKAYDAGSGWQSYGGTNPHTDHVHFSFSWAGARRQTTWWTARGPGGPGVGPGGPAAVFENGKYHVFGVKESSGVLFQNTFNGTWQGWHGLGGTVASTPAVTYHDGVFDVFARSPNGIVYQKTWDGSWTGFRSIGGIIDGGPAAVYENGRQHVFGISASGTLYQNTFNGSWQGWHGLGGTVAGTPAVTYHDGVFDVFARSPNGIMYQKTWNGSSWSAWRSIGGDFS